MMRLLELICFQDMMLDRFLEPIYTTQKHLDEPAHHSMKEYIENAHRSVQEMVETHGVSVQYGTRIGGDETVSSPAPTTKKTGALVDA